MTDMEKLTIESDGDITLCVKNPTNKLDIVEVVHDAFVASLGHENLGSVAAEILRLRERLAEANEANMRVSDENEKLRAAGLELVRQTIAEQQAEIKNLRTALKPFAKLKPVSWSLENDHYFINTDDIRTAASAMGEQDE